MKKLSTIMLGVVASIALSSCSNTIKINPDKQKYVVGVSQLVKHEALDAATNGFIDKLTSELKARGREVTIDIQLAAGDISNCSNIATAFVASDYDLIMANATPSLQAAFNSTKTIPVLGTSITDYGCALGLEMKDGKSGTNVSGTSDLANIDDQISIMNQLLPEMKNVGILYCSSEANSDFQVKEAKKAFEKRNINVTAKSFSETTDLQAVCQSMQSLDAVYIPTDNTAASNTGIIKANLTDKNIPIFAGEEGICKGCGFATLSINYYTIGEITGKMAAEILTGEKDMREYPIQYDGNPVKKYNKALCEKLNIKVPSDFVELVIEEAE